MSTLGRPKKYTPEFLEDLSIRLNLFISRQLCTATPIFLQQFAYENGIHCSQLSEFANPKEECYSKVFSEAYRNAKQIQEMDLAKGALTGKYDANFAFRTLKNVAGWRDEQHLKSEHSEKKVILIKDARAVREAELDGATATPLLTD